MEALAKRVSEKIASNLNFDSEKKSVIEYGLTAIFQMILIFSVTSIVGVIGGFWYECMVLFIGVGLLRKSVGGAHSQTFDGCLCISITTIIFFALVSRLFSHFLFLSSIHSLVVWVFVCFAFIISFIYIYFKAPVASKNKPIERPKKIKRLRRNAFLTLAIYFFAALSLIYFSASNSRLLSVSISFAFATIWQTFVLTNFGQRFINIIDLKFEGKK